MDAYKLHQNLRRPLLLAEPELLHARYAEGMADPAQDRDAEQERERLQRRLARHDREIQRLLEPIKRKR